MMRCLVGVIFDSSPVNVLGELGARFVSHQVLTLEPGKPFAFISWAASAVGKGVDCIFSSQLEPQREELWRALYSIVVYYVFHSSHFDATLLFLNHFDVFFGNKILSI